MNFYKVNYLTFFLIFLCCGCGPIVTIGSNEQNQVLVANTLKTVFDKINENEIIKAKSTHQKPAAEVRLETSTGITISQGIIVSDMISATDDMIETEYPNEYVIYRVQRSRGDRNGSIYSIAINGGTPIALSPPQTRVIRYDVLPTGTVVYFDGRSIYQVPVTGGEPQLISNGEHTRINAEYQISLDGSSLVYLAVESDGSGWNVYRSFLSGDIAGKMLPEDIKFPQKGPFDTYRFELTPDNQWLITTGENARKVVQLYSISILTGESRIINSRLPSGGTILGFAISPDSKKVIYAAEQNVDGIFEVLVTSIDVPGEPRSLYTVDQSLSKALVWFFAKFAPDSEEFLFFFDARTGRYEDITFPHIGNIMTGEVNRILNHDVHDTYTIIPSGNGRLNNYVIYEDIGVGFDVVGAVGIVPTTHKPDESVYTLVNANMASGYLFVPEKNLILYVSTMGNKHALSIQPLSDDAYMIGDTPYTFPFKTVLFHGKTGIPSWRVAATVSPDASKLVYFSYDFNNSTNLYSVPFSDGGERIQLNKFPGSTEFTHQMLRINADSTRVVYINDEEVAEYPDLYTVNIHGGEPIRLSSDEYSGISDFKLYPPGTEWHTDRLVCYTNDTYIGNCLPD